MPKGSIVVIKGLILHDKVLTKALTLFTYDRQQIDAILLIKVTISLLPSSILSSGADQMRVVLTVVL